MELGGFYQLTKKISISEAFEYLGGEEKYSTTSSKFSICSRIKNFIQHGIVQGNIDRNEVDIVSLKKYLEFEKSILENYLSPPEFRALFDFGKENSSEKIKEVLEKWKRSFSFDYIETDFPINNSTLFICKKSVESFFEHYVLIDEVKKQFSKSNTGWQLMLKKLDITPLKIGFKRFIKINDIEKINNSIYSGFSKSSIISFADSYKYIGGKEKYPTKSAINSLNARIKNLIRLGIVQGNENERLVDIDSLKEHYEFEKNIIKNYMSIKEFHVLLGTNSDTTSGEMKSIITSLEKQFYFDYIETEYPVNNRKFFISRLSVENFLKNYISIDEVEYSMNKKHFRWRNVFDRLGITPLKIGHKIFIKKNDFEMIMNDYSAIINKSNYYTLEEFKQILSVRYTRDSLVIEKDYDLKPKKVYGCWKFYEKRIVDSLKIKQNELRNLYISFEEAKEIANAEDFPFYMGYIENIPINSLLRPFYKGKTFVYEKETFFKWLEERRKKNEFFLVSMESNFDTFLNRLKIKGVNINYLGTFTSDLWLQYISNKLRSTKASPQSIDKYIYTYIYCTENLIDLICSTKSREIYSLTSKDINYLFNKIPKRNALVIYRYLEKVYNKLNANELKTFDFNKVNNPFKYRKEKQDKSIYEFEVYKKLYNYSKNIYLHKERAIKDTLKEISKSGKKGDVMYYASSWLYVLLHLNNAWRHSDVIMFPQVNLNGTQITDLNWLLNNEISDEDSDFIIKQVYRAEIVISKTQVKNYFFCSEELKKPLATAIAICQLRNNAISPLRATIIDFGNKKQDFSNTRQNHYFNQYDEYFYFSSRKMNRTLMSYSYVLLSKMQKGEGVLNSIQKMRGHVEFETTNTYIDIPEDELNFLTKQLFERGSFGFIYDLFLDILQGVEIDREKRTTETKFLEECFGSIHKIENTSGFLNVIQSDRIAILDRILSMGLDETLKFMNKIETNQLPSKQENVQCMLSETGCVKKGQCISCFDCAYSIPNYYSLSALGESLQSRLESYLYFQNIDSDMPYYEKRKKARLLYMQLNLFSQAIQRFGFEVYNFIDYSRDEFKTNIANIESLSEQYHLALE